MASVVPPPAAALEGSEARLVEVRIEIERPMSDDSQVIELVDADLPEPYSVFTYRYFLHNWPGLCMMAVADGKILAATVSKIEPANGVDEGYIAMLAVDKEYRGSGVATAVVKQSIRELIRRGCKHIILEAEASNQAALGLYQKLGFTRSVHLPRYYFDGSDALRLKLVLD